MKEGNVVARSQSTRALVVVTRLRYFTGLESRHFREVTYDVWGRFVYQQRTIQSFVVWHVRVPPSSRTVSHVHARHASTNRVEV